MLQLQTSMANFCTACSSVFKRFSQQNCSVTLVHENHQGYTRNKYKLLSADIREPCGEINFNPKAIVETGG